MVLHRCLLAVLLCAVASVTPAAAQSKGLYIPGQFGLDAGVLPDPGLTYDVAALNYTSESLRGRQGEEVATVGRDAYWIQENVITYVPAVRVFGGKLASTIMIPFANGSVTIPNFATGTLPYAVGDVFVQPLAIGWRLFARVDLTAGYAFVAPTGSYSSTAESNVGSGYWGQMVTSGSTVYLSRRGGTRANLYVNWETHGHVKDTDFVPGQALTFEWGIGHVFALDANRHTLLELGVVGYDQTQASENSAIPSKTLIGSVTPMYRVHAAGAQAILTLPTHHLSVYAKFEPEYSATSRPKGLTAMVGAKVSLPIGTLPEPTVRP